MSERISVIVPVYKVEPYLRKCVDSILAQTYTNLEIILVDDGSPDSCGAICDEYAAKDNRVRVIHKPNGGLSDARNAGLNIATGKRVTFVDSDDWIDTDHIFSLYSITENQPPNTIAVSDVLKVNINKDIISCFTYNCNESIINQSAFGFVWNKLYPISLVSDIRFMVGCKFAEDLIFNMQILKGSPNYVFTENKTYNYLHREASITTAIISDKKIDDWIGFTKLYEKALAELISDKEAYLRQYNHVIGNLSCNLMCDITICQSIKSAGKNRLMYRLMSEIEKRSIRWKYADNNLLKLFALTIRMRCPLIYRVVYSILLKRNRVDTDG